MAHSNHYGIVLPNGSQIVHGLGAKLKEPFTDIPVTLHELSPGHFDHRPAFRGQSGFIKFDTDTRLPRHVHISSSKDDQDDKILIHERIFVVGGVALVELSGMIYVIPPKTLVTIAPGVPHTWTACPAGVNVSKTTTAGAGKDVISDGTFLMLYEYEDVTGFFPTAQTTTLTSVDEYIRCDDLDSIRIPKLTAQEVEDQCCFVNNNRHFSASG